jgi:hypothetical protein
MMPSSCNFHSHTCHQTRETTNLPCPFFLPYASTRCRPLPCSAPLLLYLPNCELACRALSLLRRCHIRARLSPVRLPLRCAAAIIAPIVSCCPSVCAPTAPLPRWAPSMTHPGIQCGNARVAILVVRSMCILVI